VRLEILLSTMNQKDLSFVEKMNIKSDAIVINQSNYFDYVKDENTNKVINMYTFHEKGVGLSRNSALMRTTADICLFADDDVIYNDDYVKTILNEFKIKPSADIIIFNVPSTNLERNEHINKKSSRLHFFNILRYGTFRIAAKVSSLKKNDLYFSLLFGGGTKYGSGEDSIFLVDALKSGLKIYASEKEIGSVNHINSTWFDGVNEKFIKDKGALFARISRNFFWIISIHFCVRRRKIFKDKFNIFQVFILLINGAKAYKKVN